MEITIRRIHQNDSAIDGYLTINSTQVCDTAECRETALPAGDYPIRLVKCKQYGKRCLCVGEPTCELCRQLKPEMVFSNTLMPRVCPMLKMGNGVSGRRDGSIIVGERVSSPPASLPEAMGDDSGQQLPTVPVWGTMIHSQAAYEKVFDRVRKTIERGKEVRLRVQ